MEIYTSFIPALINLHFNIPPYSGCFIIQRLHNYYLTASIRPYNSPVAPVRFCPACSRSEEQYPAEILSRFFQAAATIFSRK